MVAKGHLNRPDAAGGETVLAWRGRARFRWRVAVVFFGIALLGALLLSFTLTSAVWPTSGCTPRLCPKAPIAEPGQAWGAVTALGTLAAGIGTLVSAIAAVLALRAATAARTATVAPAKRSTVKRPRKRKRA
jgi:uncharacterized membrane protein